MGLGCFFLYLNIYFLDLVKWLISISILVFNQKISHQFLIVSIYYDISRSRFYSFNINIHFNKTLAKCRSLLRVENKVRSKKDTSPLLSCWQQQPPLLSVPFTSDTQLLISAPLILILSSKSMISHGVELQPKVF